MNVDIVLYNQLIDKAMEKQDGVFSKNKWKCFAKDGRLKYYGNKYNGIYEVFGSFTVQIFSGSSYNFEASFKELCKNKVKG